MLFSSHKKHPTIPPNKRDNINAVLGFLNGIIWIQLVVPLGKFFKIDERFIVSCEEKYFLS